MQKKGPDPTEHALHEALRSQRDADVVRVKKPVTGDESLKRIGLVRGLQHVVARVGDHPQIDARAGENDLGAGHLIIAAREGRFESEYDNRFRRGVLGVARIGPQRDGHGRISGGRHVVEVLGRKGRRGGAGINIAFRHAGLTRPDQQQHVLQFAGAEGRAELEGDAGAILIPLGETEPGINRPEPVERTTDALPLGEGRGNGGPEQGGDEQGALESAGEDP